MTGKPVPLSLSVVQSLVECSMSPPRQWNRSSRACCQDPSTWRTLSSSSAKTCARKFQVSAVPDDSVGRECSVQEILHPHFGRSSTLLHHHTLYVLSKNYHCSIQPYDRLTHHSRSLTEFPGALDPMSIPHHCLPSRQDRGNSHSRRRPIVSVRVPGRHDAMVW